jgi:hypothetical protein
MQPNHNMIVRASRRLCGTGVLALILSVPAALAGISVSSQSSDTRIAFVDTDPTEIGGTSFAAAGTYDGIVFSQWTGAVTTAKTLSAGVSIAGTASYGANRTGLGGTQQYNQVTYTNSNAAGTFTITGLDSLKTYRIQYGFHDGRNGSFPYSVNATLTLSDNSFATQAISIGAVGTADDYELVEAQVSGTTSLALLLPQAGNGIGSAIAAFSVHEITPPAGEPVSTNDSRTFNEDTQPLLAIDDFGTYSDPNTLPLAAVKITTLPITGNLEYDSDGAANWVAVAVDQEISVAHITAGRLRFSPDLDGNGSPYTTVGFRVSNGTLFSLASYTLTLNVTPINDYAPTAADQTVEVAQGGSKTLSAVNFAFADDDGNDTLQEIEVTQLPTAGTLALNAVAVTLNQQITVADINAGLLTFTPELTASSGSAYATFGFKVSDGTFYSVVSSTMTVDIVPVLVTQSAARIPFVNSGTLVGAAVFGGAATYDGIPFSLWDTPFTTSTHSLGSGVSVTLAITGGAGGGGVTGGAFGTSQQYQFGAYPNSSPRGMTLTFTGLVSSREYRFQFGYGDTRTIYDYNENATVTLDVASPPAVNLAFGSAAAGDEYALLTATATNTTTLVLTLPHTVPGNHGPMQAGFSVHTIDGATDYDTWADGTFANGTLSDKTPGGDPDGDGLTNQEEYAFGLDPSSGSSVNPITVPLNKTTGMFTYTRRATPAITGLTYTVQTSTDLATWTTDATATATQDLTGTVGDVQTVDVTVTGAPLTAPSLFVRVKAD